jgi:uncharacterized membrane protein YesL
MAQSKRQFGEGPIYTVTNFIYWFFLGNLYFLLMNIPLVFITFVYLANGTNQLPEGFPIIAVICCIPIGPAATALLSVMGKLIREKDVNITKDFFKAYKTNFFQSLFFCALEIILLVLLYMDIRFFASNNYSPILTLVIYIFMIFIFLMGLYVFPLISRFYLGTKEIMKIGAYYTTRKIHITLMNFASFLVVDFIFTKFTFVVLFMASIICYLLMFYQRSIHLELEEKFKKNFEANQE